MIRSLNVLVLMLAALLVSTAGVASDAPSAEDRAERLRSRLDAFLVGATINDAAVHDAFWAEELVYTSSGGTRFGKASLMSGVRESGPVAMGSVSTIYSARDAAVELLDDVALLEFVLVASDRDGGEAYYLNSGVFVWRDGRWQAIRWQATKQASDD